MSAQRSPRSEPIPIDTLRAALREAIGTRSVRHIAAEIGISHTGLRGFLGGAHSHQHTLLKIQRWLTGDAARRVREVGGTYEGSVEGAYALGQAAVHALAQAVDPRLTAEAAQHFYTLIARLYQDNDKEPPEWLVPPE